MNEIEINDYLSKCDKDLANNVIYRVYGMPGPIFMEEENNTPTPEPGPDYSIPFYVENITQEDETLTIAGYDYLEKNNYLQIPVEYSLDGTNWSSLGTTGETPLTRILQPGEQVYLRAETDTWYEYQDDGSEENIDHSCSIFGVSKVGGNAMSLLYGSSFTGNETTFPDGSIRNFSNLFSRADVEDTELISASELILPVTTLTEGCYSGMFFDCKSLTQAPELPATTLAEQCYSQMFYGCKSLTTTPELPATTLAEQCYYGMFSGCTSLTINNIPSLPATTLATNCYTDTFNSITMSEGEYNVWCSENIPEAANYDESIHGRLFNKDLS